MTDMWDFRSTTFVDIKKAKETMYNSLNSSNPLKLPNELTRRLPEMMTD